MTDREKIVDEERREALYAMSYCAKKWRHSITHMRRHVRDDEADALDARLNHLDRARRKLRGLTPPDEEAP